MKKELIYITDAYCLWCFGFSKAISEIAKTHADDINIRVLNGGMIPSDLPLRTMFSRFPDPIGLHKRVEQMADVRFGSSYLDEIKNFNNSRRILNSTYPAMAMLTFKHLGVKAELTLAHAIQHAYYINNKDLQRVETYKSIAHKFGIEFTQFKSQFAHTARLKSGVATEKKWVSQLGIQGFPALLLRKDENRFASIANGFLSFDDLKFNLDRALQKPQERPPSPSGTCSLETGNCS
jgi:putative protein-disulfide isomerase